VVFWLGAIAFLQLYRRERRTFETREAEAFFEVLPILAACFAFAYFVQHKGWYYHTIPITTILAIAIGLHLTRMGSSRMLPIAIGLALLALPASTALTPRPERQPIVKVSAKLLGSLPVGEPVFIGSVAPRLAWPTTEQRKLVWTSRAFTLWMLPAIAEGELIGPNTPELRSLANTVLTATSEDIRCHPPTQIIIQRGLNVREQSRAFNVRDFLFRDTQLRRFLDDHYAEQPPTPLVYVYLRKGPIEGISNSACRTIR
jgi:hypothetical protein